MLNTTLPARARSRIEIEFSQDLLTALQKIDGAALSKVERFEIAALTFIVARALHQQTRQRGLARSR